jgi:hypothetical protein
MSDETPLPDPIATLTLGQASEALRQALGNDIYVIGEHVRSLVTNGKLPLFNGGRRVHGNSVAMGMVSIIACCDPYDSLARLEIELTRAASPWFPNSCTLGRAALEEHLLPELPPQLEAPKLNKGGRPTEFPADDIIARAFIWLAKNGTLPLHLTGENSLVEKIAFEFGITNVTPAVTDRLADVLRKPYNRAKEWWHVGVGN